MVSEAGARGAPRRAAIPPESVIAFLAGTSLFKGVDRTTLERIAPHVFAAEVPTGTIIIRAGTPDPGIGFLYAGKAVVRQYDPSSGQPMVLEQITVGDAFGDTGAFT